VFCVLSEVIKPSHPRHLPNNLGVCPPKSMYDHTTPSHYSLGQRLFSLGRVITECKSIRIVESSIMDGLDERYLAQCRSCFSKVVFGKWRKVPDGVLGGYRHGTRKV
jgi:hypothetical protein